MHPSGARQAALGLRASRRGGVPGRLARSARSFAAAALLALSGALALPATAEAQNCMLNTGDVWCGVVTVAAGTSEYGFDSVADYGSLTDNSGDRLFTYGMDPTIYAV